MSEIARNDITVEGKVLDSGAPQEQRDLLLSDRVVSAYSLISPHGLAEAIAEGETGVTQLKTALHDVAVGSSDLILKLTHAKTVASAYTVRLTDLLATDPYPGKGASFTDIKAALRETDPDADDVTDARISQYRNAAKVLIDLDFPLSSMEVGPLLSINGISAPLKAAMALANEGKLEEARATFLTEAGAALEKQRAMKRARSAKKLDTGTETKDEPTADTPDVVTNREGTPPNGNGKDDILILVSKMPLATPEDIARLLMIAHAITVHVATADPAVREAGEKIAAADIAEAEAAQARLAAPKPAPRKR